MKLQGAITVLKILSKSGQEFQLFPQLAPYAYVCSLNASKVWERMNFHDLNIDSLPTLEVQVLKVHAYQALIDVATKSDNIAEIRSSVAGAMDAVKELSVGLKLSFGRNALQVGMRQVEIGECADAIVTFRVILQVLDAVLSNAAALKAYCAEGGGVSEPDDGRNTRIVSEHYIHILKIKTQLALVFSFTQMNQPDKALLCLQDVEKTSLKSLDALNSGAAEAVNKREVKQAILRAKFSAYVCMKDWQDAETALRALVNLTSSHALAIESVTLFLDSDAANKRNFAAEYYSMLLTKFPKDPEYTKTRISQLVSVLSELMFPDYLESSDFSDVPGKTPLEGGVVSASDPARQALEICSAIVLDHVRGVHELSDEHFLTLTELCCNQISFHRSKSNWSVLQSWSELVLRLLQHSVKAVVSAPGGLSSTSMSIASEGASTRDLDVNRKIGHVMLHKADALSHMQQHTQALELVLAAAKLQPDPVSIVTAFQVCLRGQGGLAAVSLLTSLLDTAYANRATGGIIATPRKESYRHPSTHGLETDLEILVICLKLVLQLEFDPMQADLAPECLVAQSLLLKEWLRRYQQSRQWRVAAESGGVSDSAINDAVSYFGFTGEVVRRFLLKFMRTVGIVTPASADKPPAVYHVNLPDSSPDLKETESGSLKRPLESPREVSQSKLSRSDDSGLVKETAEHAKVIDLKAPDGKEPGILCNPQYDPRGSQDTQPQDGESYFQSDAPCTAPLLLKDKQLMTSQVDLGSTDMKVDETEETHAEVGANSGCEVAPETPRVVDSFVYEEAQLPEPGGFHALFKAEGRSRYEFQCRVEDLREGVLTVIGDCLRTVDMANADEADLQHLGSAKHLEWLAEASWNLSALLVRENACSFRESNSMDETGASSDESLARLQLAAELAEKADALYALVPYEDRLLGRQNQCTCLLVASGARITADILLLNKASTQGEVSAVSNKLSSFSLDPDELVTAPSAKSGADEEVRANLAAAERDCVKVDTMIRSCLSLADDEQLQTMHQINLIYQFTLMCKQGGDPLSVFVKSRKLELLQLSAEKLIECSEIARLERGGTTEAVRALLVLAQQVCMKEQLTRESPLSTVFVRLIECSSSREQALAKIEEFEQLLVCGGTRREVDTVFSEETVYSVLVQAHNFGVQLLHLGDADLAERFVSKAMNLSRYAPNRGAEVRDSIQCTYTSLLEAKQKRHQSIIACGNKLGLDFSADASDDDRVVERALLEDAAGGSRRLVEGPLSNAHLFA